jgi:fibronectin type 3 domain-containing protein
MNATYSVTANFATTPDPPTNLTATTYDYQRVDLSWDEPTYDGDGTILGYKIERETPIDGGWSTLVSNTSNNQTTYSDTTVSSDTQYNYRVSTINEADTSIASNEASATTDRAPIIVSGTAYSDQGTTAFGSGKTVALLINGSLADTTQTQSDGSYEFSDDYFDSGDMLII